MKYKFEEIENLSEAAAAEEYVEYRLRENLNMAEIDYLEKITQRLLDITSYLPAGRPMGYLARILQKGAIQRGLYTPEPEESEQEKTVSKNCSCSSRNLFDYGCRCGGE